MYEQINEILFFQKELENKQDQKKKKPVEIRKKKKT